MNTAAATRTPAAASNLDLTLHVAFLAGKDLTAGRALTRDALQAFRAGTLPAASAAQIFVSCAAVGEFAVPAGVDASSGEGVRLRLVDDVDGDAFLATLLGAVGG